MLAMGKGKTISAGQGYTKFREDWPRGDWN